MSGVNNGKESKSRIAKEDGGTGLGRHSEPKPAETRFFCFSDYGPDSPRCPDIRAPNLWEGTGMCGQSETGKTLETALLKGI